MKVLRFRLLVTLVLAAVVLTLGSGAALASLRTPDATGSVSVSQGDRPTATLYSGEPDIGQGGIAQPPQQRGLRPNLSGWDISEGAWWTWISRIWASWSLRGVR